ncbi:MAG: TonB-dependent receptor [Bacteroidales bacterium]|nr:TonB-dependent receptor [Bacteroidales bacterium]MCF8398154.1 TonB-dependent receptor [Bacteroidales bacterium]
MPGTRIIATILFIFATLALAAQKKAVIFGKVSDHNGKGIELANISISGKTGGTSTNKKGEYELRIPGGEEVVVLVSFIGYEKKSIRITVPPGIRRELNIKLKTISTELPGFEVKDERVRQTNFTRIDPKEAKVVPSISGGVEDLIKTLPGVASSNELSSQYSVRGGNFDENLVYVNGIEIYRPFLIRSGQQEGLSFLNSDLVSSIQFSAGGFDAKYGDKMSSVLDIKYKRPVEFAASVSASLLGAQGHVEGISASRKFTYLMGIRYQSNQYILSGLQTEGDYKPNFTDIQTLLSYKLNKNWNLSFLGNYARNSYKLIPSSRTTKFGTIKEAYQLKIYFDGQEVDNFETFFGALSAEYNPIPNLQLRFTASAFQTIESETFDIQGQYWIGRLETDFGQEQFGDVVEAQGVGTYLDHARNYLYATVMNAQHRGTYNFRNQILQWGVKLQHEIIDDQLNEWEMVDSAGFTIPRPGDSVGSPDPPHPDLILNDVVKTDIDISSNRYTGFVQNTWEFAGYKADKSFTLGGRFNYWDFNEQFLFSPRASFSIKPNWGRDVLFRFAAGYYYQPPFYKELRDLEGNLNYDIKAQKSIHFVAGADYNFFAWSRPFKLTSEVYYKYLDDLIPYEVDNVRIRYYADNNAHGYAAGVDLKINGEFVKGVESWASLSVMKTEEDIEDDFYYEYYNDAGELIIPGFTENNVVADSTRFEPGFIPRPTDQRITFSMFFQDYLPNNPTYKMHLKLIYGSRLPFGPPDSPKHEHTLRIPPYRRVDIGFSKQIIGENTKRPARGFFSHFESLWITAEVFNLLQINNTVSYIWVKDVNNREYAVPNYLTPRQLNIRIVASF